MGNSLNTDLVYDEVRRRYSGEQSTQLLESVDHHCADGSTRRHTSIQVAHKRDWTETCLNNLGLLTQIRFVDAENVPVPVRLSFRQDEHTWQVDCHDGQFNTSVYAAAPDSNLELVEQLRQSVAVSAVKVLCTQLEDGNFVVRGGSDAVFNAARFDMTVVPLESNSIVGSVHLVSGNVAVLGVVTYELGAALVVGLRNCTCI